MEHTTIAVDLAKSVFQVALSRRPGHVNEERRLSRARFRAYMAQQPAATVPLEAWRVLALLEPRLQQLGHTVRLIPAHDVHRYVRRNKTDRTDTKVLLEAGRNEEIHSVPTKTVEQQAIASLLRLRSTWLATRTARLNTVRGLLREFGITIPVGAQRVVPQIRALVDDSSAVPVALHAALANADEIGALVERIGGLERQLAALAQQMPDVALLQTIPGVGLITASALVALVGDVRRFPTGRRFASSLGLTPTEDSSAGRRRLGAISKQGDRYLRMPLIHGARSFLWTSKKTSHPDALRVWALRTEQRRGHNIAQSRSQINSHVLSGRSGHGTVHSSLISARRKWQIVRRYSTHQEDRTELQSRHGAPVGPAGGRVDNAPGLRGRAKPIGSPRANSMMARRGYRASNEAEDTSAV